MTASILTLNDGSTLAYHQYTPDNPTTPGVIFLGGFKSDMEGTKAVFLERFCKEHQIPFIRFDYFGHGKSSGAFTDGTIGRWKQDILTILETLTTGPQILIGSSLGGWLMLLATQEVPDRIAGLIGVAAAPDFTETLMWDQFDETQRKTLTEKGIYHLPSDYCEDPEAEEEPYPITLTLIEEARNHLLLKGSIPINCPIRLLHGTQDADVPFDTSLTLSKHVTSDDVTVLFQKSGDHRMSSEASLSLLQNTLERLLEHVTL